MPSPYSFTDYNSLHLILVAFWKFLENYYDSPSYKMSKSRDRLALYGSNVTKIKTCFRHKVYVNVLSQIRTITQYNVVSVG